MTPLITSNAEPIAISMIAGRYLLFDIDVVTYLRRAHHICGVFIGSIPQVPQQNVFLGLPVELLPEEAKILVEKKVAYIVNDSLWHEKRFSTLDLVERKSYLASLESEGRKAQDTAERESRKRAERAFAKHATSHAPKQTTLSHTHEENLVGVFGGSNGPEDIDSVLFEGVRRQLPIAKSLISTLGRPSHTITPATSCLFGLAPEDSSLLMPIVPASYPLYAHLHAHDYFLTPGLRFGCDYTVYPGDPLRFHSHFLAVGYRWTEEIPLLDLVGGGRLGTGVKKGFLIGGKDVDSNTTSAGKGQNVRTFCIEWGGM